MLKKTIDKFKSGGLFLTRGLKQPTVLIRNTITNSKITVDFVGWHENKKHGPQVRLKINAPDEYRISRPERLDGERE